MGLKRYAIVQVIDGKEKIACIKNFKEWAENCLCDYCEDDDGKEINVFVKEIDDGGYTLKEFEDKLDNLDLPGEGYYEDVDFLDDTFRKLWDWLDEDTRRIFVAEVINEEFMQYDSELYDDEDDE